MIVVRMLAAWMALAGLAAAQESAVFSFVCTEDDIREFGLTCDEEEPCPVFLEIAAVEAAGSTLVLSGNLHTQATTMFGVLLVSEDGGQSWTEPAKRLKWAALEHIQFADFQHGWVSGVMLEPLPRDPFFMITSDGGKTWRRRPMFDDAHFGSIQQFWFDSEKSGELILDASQGAIRRYEVHATMTGGDSWEVKETTRTQPRLARARPRENPTWRVRVDSAAKAYRVEKRVIQATGEGWETAAVFPVAAGECK
jgi:photosystem II stability/assembly factor-like uncharacterized protein